MTVATIAGRCRAGEVQDPGYSLDLFASRAYDPTTGAFTSQDAFRGLLTVPQSLHRYAYVADNPLTLTDQGGYSFLGDLWNGVTKAATAVAKGVATAAKAVAGAVTNVAKAVVNTVKTVVSNVVAGTAAVAGGVASAVTRAQPSSGGTKPKTNTGAGSATGKSITGGGYAGTGLTRDQYWNGCTTNKALNQSQYAKLHPNVSAQAASVSVGSSSSKYSIATPRGGCPAGTTLYTNPYTDPQCVSKAALKQRAETSGDRQLSACYLVCAYIGAHGGGVGIGSAEGVVFSAGATRGSVRGFVTNRECDAELGGGGYVSRSMKWDGNTSPSVGAAAGMGLGCSINAGYSW